MQGCRLVDITYLYLGNLLAFTDKKTRLPLPAERLSCLYIQLFAYMDATCKVGLWKKCVMAQKCPKKCGNRAFGNLLYVLHKNNTPASH